MGVHAYQAIQNCANQTRNMKPVASSVAELKQLLQSGMEIRIQHNNIYAVMGGELFKLDKNPHELEANLEHFFSLSECRVVA